MQRVTFFLRGVLRVRAQGASPELLPDRLARSRIAFWDLRRIDEFTVEFSLFRADLARLRQAAGRCMCTVSVLQVGGARAALGGLRHRLVLVFGVLLAVAAALAMQRYIWYFDISGNETVSDLRILAALEDAGVHAGARGGSVDAQAVENRVLAAMPELQQITVNLYGGCAEVLVRERDAKPELIDRRTPCNLVASRSGLILEMDILNGDAVVKPGDAVLQGQLLVSGLGDRTLGTQEMHAYGEVYARTWRKKTAVLPEIRLEKRPSDEAKRSYALILWKKRIKLSLSSGISGGSCDKMTVVRPLTLPGGIRLPFALETDIRQPYVLQAVQTSTAELKTRMERTMAHELLEGAVAAEIQETKAELSRANGLWSCRAVFTCREMIARESQIYKSGEESNDGTDDKRGTGRTDH